MPRNWLQKNYPPEADFPDINRNCNTALSKVLTHDMYAKYRDILTPTGFTFDQVIQVGIDCPDSSDNIHPGCVAGDEESYRVFKDFFDFVISECHDGYAPNRKHTSNLNWTELGCLDDHYILRVRLKFNRNIRGLCLPSHCTRNERRIVEKITAEALASLKGSFKGQYSEMRKIATSEKKMLLKEGLLFNTFNSPLHFEAGMARDWPDARGVWYTDDKRLAAWVNNEDHLSLISTHEGGDFRECFKHLCQAASQVKSALKSKEQKFMKGSHLGHICSFPNKLGGFEISVRVSLPNIAEDIDQLDQLLSVRGLCKSKPDDLDPDQSVGIYDISNTSCLGLSESEWLKHVIDTLQSIIQIEQDLEKELNSDS